ncbi:Uncharacterised protein [Bordetella pertussis]|nr:Uncharacterised protein [Bordetella pertussis]CFP65394.1 Uncharacterised protein [Bordetella pertussis]CFT90912.1 Uncharacterised protein [Bordetella pertussis]CPO29258.1 Uncharacterised protein [Bordetella pertussis]CPO78836.1 Uncharacterised protein [Bordetella pertussis]
MSAGLTPAAAKARADDALQPKSVRLGAATMCSWVCPWPAPRISTDRLLLAALAARLLITSAAPPSEIRQQSSRRSGVLISREFSTSSMEIGSRLCALGWRPAWRRCSTAMAARCSGVAPYSCM